MRKLAYDHAPIRTAVQHPARALRCLAYAGRLRTLLALAMGATYVLTVAHASASAVKRPLHTHVALPGADCQPYSSVPCLLPFPDDRLTREDF